MRGAAPHYLTTQVGSSVNGWVIAGGAALVLVLANLAWRYLSRRWNLPCPTWLAWGLDNPFLVWLLGTRTTIDRLDLQPGQHVLEIGPGPGRLLLPAARRVLPDGRAVGVDLQPGMIDRLVHRAKASGLSNVEGIVADAATVELPTDRFDVVIIALTLGEIPRREDALQRAFFALKPGGLLSITELFPDPHFTRRGTVRRLAEAAGFEHRSTGGCAIYFNAHFTKRAQ